MYKRKDLKFQEFYHWADSDTASQLRLDSKELFDKTDGWQVLQLINLFAQKHELIQISSCHKIEVSVCLCNQTDLSVVQMIDYLEKDLSTILSALMIGRRKD